jgi:16S rRNA processing protein RimM
VARSDATTPDIAAAKIVGVYGIKGWVKLKVNLENPASLTSLKPQFLTDSRQQSRRPIRVLNVRVQGKGYIASLEGVEDRSAAELLRGHDIMVPKSSLPVLADGEFYWDDLVGCTVRTHDDEGSALDLGTVNYLLETGANDVLVVRASETSIDDRERLIPYIEDDVVVSVDLVEAVIDVNWHADD